MIIRGLACVALAASLLIFHFAAVAADLVGVVFREGKPAPHVSVILLDAGKEVARARTNGNGRFRIPGLRPDVYEIRCGNRPAVRVRVSYALTEINCQG